MSKTRHIGLNTFALAGQRTGAGMYISKLVEYLAQVDRDNRYTLFLNRANAAYFSAIAAPNFSQVTCHALTRLRPLRLIWEQLRLPAHLLQRQIDILHSPAFVAPLAMKAKSVLTIFDLTFFLFPEHHSPMKRWYFGTMMPEAVRKADAVIAISETSRQDILRIFGIPAAKVAVTYLAADTTYQPVSDQLRLNRLKAAYGIEGDFLLFVGVREPRKNLMRLLAAYLRLKKEKKISAKLVIAGKRGWGKVPVEAFIARHGLGKQVILTGHVPEEDKILLYNAATLFVYPSLYEGFGLPVIEAMASGTPVVTSQTSSLKEIAEGAAALVDPLSEDEIFSRIYELLQDAGSRRKLRDAGLRRAQQFSWEKTALATKAVYEGL